MEITYDTGAKVILQGPVTYEVESADGGFLSVGKLTARLEKKGRAEGRRRRKYRTVRVSNSSFIPHPSSFVRRPHSHRHRHRPGHRVRRGSERDGQTESHVFVGKVRLVGRGSLGGNAERLLQGQAVRLDRRGGGVVFASSDVRFIRELPDASAERELIGQVDYSDTWTVNSPTRYGGYRVLTSPEELQVEQCHGNPPRSWVFSAPTAVTTWPGDNSLSVLARLRGTRFELGFHRNGL